VTAPVATVSPVYTGFTPIASCHWQSLSNILAARGLADANRSLCPTWGFRWTGDGVLFGGGRWPELVRQLFGIRIEEHTFADPGAAERFERSLGRAGLPFVAEIDAYYVPSPYHGVEHVVHTVVVTHRDAESAVILDTTNHPTPSTVPIGRYRQLRGTPCVGRLDPYRLYLPVPGTPAQPTADEILTAVRDDLTGHGAAGLDAFARFMDWYAGSAEVISVTRAAAERFAAAGLFELLAERGCAPAAEAAAGLRELSDAWYTVHLLTVHPRAGDSRHRQRVLRLMRQLADAERRFLDRLPG